MFNSLNIEILSATLNVSRQKSAVFTNVYNMDPKKPKMNNFVKLKLYDQDDDATASEDNNNKFESRSRLVSNRTISRTSFEDLPVITTARIVRSAPTAVTRCPDRLLKLKARSDLRNLLH